MLLHDDLKDFIVPSVYESMSTQRILTSDYLYGDDLD